MNNITMIVSDELGNTHFWNTITSFDNVTKVMNLRPQTLAVVMEGVSKEDVMRRIDCVQDFAEMCGMRVLRSEITPMVTG